MLTCTVYLVTLASNKVDGMLTRMAGILEREKNGVFNLIYWLVDPWVSHEVIDTSRALCYLGRCLGTR
jgi:hypothetical protein